MRVLLILGALTAMAVGGDYVRLEAEGIHNAVSPKYWLDRATGQDLYDPALAVFKRGDRSEKSLVLTFDDGPHPDSAESILDTLDRYGVKATFFLVGERVYQHPEMVRRMLAEGHEVGNHTLTHPALDKMSLDKVKQEIAGCEVAVERTTGREMTLFRPPHLRFTSRVASLAKSMGYTLVGYNVAAGDFIRTKTDPRPPGETSNLEVSPEIIAQRVLRNVKNGSIILLHDSPATAEALPAILRALTREGYKFETCAQMLGDLPKPITLVANPTTNAPRNEVLPASNSIDEKPSNLPSF